MTTTTNNQVGTCTHCGQRIEMAPAGRWFHVWPKWRRRCEDALTLAKPMSFGDQTVAFNVHVLELLEQGHDPEGLKEQVDLMVDGQSAERQMAMIASTVKWHGWQVKRG